MEIVSCFTSLSEIAPLAEAGASEFYCGVDGIPGFSRAGLPNLRALRSAVGRVHGSGRRIAVAMNAVVFDFSGRSRAAFMARVVEMDRLGVDSLIIANPAFFPMLEEYRRDNGIGPLRAGFQLSSVQPCLNHMAVEFFRKFGVVRVILPNQLSAREAGRMLTLCKRSGIETEIFDHRFFGCRYMNGNCRLHPPLLRGADCGLFCGNGGGGGAATAFHILPGREREAASLGRRVGASARGGSAARIGNAASFFDYHAAGVGYVKYGTRTDDSETKVRKVRRIREMVKLAEDLIRDRGTVRARSAFLSRMSAGDWMDGR